MFSPFLILLATVQALDTKNLAGSPADFSLHRIQDPATVPHVSRSLSKSIWFNQFLVNITENGLVYSCTLPIDGTKDVALAFSSPVAQHLSFELRDPNDKVVKGQSSVDRFHLGDESSSVPAYTFLVRDPIEGVYTFYIYSQSLTEEHLRELNDNPYPDALLMLMVDDDIKITSHLLTYVIHPGSKVGIVSTITDAGNPYTSSSRSVVVNSGQMSITNPLGQTETIPMVDNGESSDAHTGDGYFTGAIIVTQPGAYLVEAKLDGRFVNPETLQETPFQRTTQHLIQVSHLDMNILGQAKLSNLDHKRYILSIPVKGSSTKIQLRAYTEVYGTSAEGKEVPVCWLGGLVLVDNNQFQLFLDKRWLIEAGITMGHPLILKNTYVSDLQTSFPIATFDQDIIVQGSSLATLHNLHSVRAPVTEEDWKEMKNGVRPTRMTSRAKSNVTADLPNLVLLPGYCADVNPWSRKASDFSNGIFPLKYGNFPNDEYAKHMIEQIEAHQLKDFGIIAHSQGGMVSLHIHNYYWTGLEDAKGERLIQTLGTPFQGTSASGTAANLAKIFGIACGSNTDLSRDGAANWLSGISMDSRKDVYSYGSTYSPGNFFGDYCSLPMNFILQWPNDGITEINYAQLPGGNWLGSIDKWCHTVDMTYPPQYDDDSRNAVMNKVASR